MALRTPGMVIDRVWSKLEVAGERVCWSQRAFYLLRAALMEYAGTSERIAWTREKVAVVVKVIVMEQLGLAEAEYREDADFIRDFRMG